MFTPLRPVRLLAESFFALLIVALSVTPAMAGAAHTISAADLNKGTYTAYLNPYIGSAHELAGEEAVKNLKSSKKSVVEVSGDNKWGWIIVLHKKGTAKLTYKHDGKKRTCKVTVLNWTNPASKVSVGSVNLTSKFKKKDSFEYGEKFQKLKGKVLRVKAKPGWKLDEIFVWCYSDAYGTMPKSIKNGAKIPKNATSIMVSFRNTKNGGFEMIAIGK